MIVRLFRPTERADGTPAPHDAPWLVANQAGVIGAITPTPQLQSQMEGMEGDFEVEETDEGFEVIRRVERQPW